MEERTRFAALMSRVEALACAGETAAARAALQQEAFDTQPGWHHVCARLSLDLREIETAVEHSCRAVALAPTNPHYRALLAASLYVASEQEPSVLDVAEMEAEHALAIDPTTPSAENTLGLVRLAQGRPMDARGHFERALRASPNDASARSNLAMCTAV